MAGGILKTLGGLLIVVGALGLLAGLGAAGFGFFDEQQNQGQFISDADRSGRNEALLVYGGTGAAAGLVVLVVGILFASWGGARSQAALRRELRLGIQAAAAAPAAPPAEPTPAPARKRPDHRKTISRK